MMKDYGVSQSTGVRLQQDFFSTPCVAVDSIISHKCTYENEEKDYIFGVQLIT